MGKEENKQDEEVYDRKEAVYISQSRGNKPTMYLIS